MADLFLLIGNKKYSSWSLRPWLVLKQAGLAFDEQQVALSRPDTRANILKYSPSGRVNCSNPVDFAASLHSAGIASWQSALACSAGRFCGSVKM